MFKHILLPTDGSKLSEKSVKQGIRMAKALKANVTALHVIPKFHAFAYQLNMLESTQDQFSDKSADVANEYLSFVKKVASVECDVAHVTSDKPFKEIIDTAKKKKCDLIMMASHGRRGVER